MVVALLFADAPALLLADAPALLVVDAPALLCVSLDELLELIDWPPPVLVWSAPDEGAWLLSLCVELFELGAAAVLLVVVLPLLWPFPLPPSPPFPPDPPIS